MEVDKALDLRAVLKTHNTHVQYQLDQIRIDLYNITLRQIQHFILQIKRIQLFNCHFWQNGHFFIALKQQRNFFQKQNDLKDNFKFILKLYVCILYLFLFIIKLIYFGFEFIHLQQIYESLLSQINQIYIKHISNKQIILNKSMQNRNIIILLVSLLVLTHVSYSYTCKKYIYDHNLLVLDWAPQFCYHHQSCKPNWKQVAPQNQWIIRGLWPASKDLDFLNCIQYAGHDPNCYVAYEYNENNLNSALKTQLTTFWSEIISTNDIKSDQWNQHGTCYLSVIQTKNPSMIGNEAKIFDSYFRDTVTKTKTVNIKLNATQTQFKTKAQLSATIGVKQDQFYALCEYDPAYLSQIRICYDMKGLAGSENTISCLVQQPNQCEFPVKVRKAYGYNVQMFLALIMLILILIY